eukprot:CAMPEP_0168316712 /NCGR_PEP_ID=MMETSP0210-20121227/18471_1 /TAXON_ID=40633 /ORGANISM="Condylostoma magnum, Strain COL2" /LENGTH=34 /DNA_ID= /DNA_START= /DNA_END= /DNA_ORIENTATION=
MTKSFELIYESAVKGNPDSFANLAVAYANGVGTK